MVDRVIWIVLDSVGMGSLPDAEQYGDVGANTIYHVWEHHGGLEIPNMLDLGLGNIEGMKGLERTAEPEGCYARVKEKSVGKSTTTGHWEMVGVYSDSLFPTYPDGFPDEVIEPFEEAIGKKVLGNRPASGTEIIVELDEEHFETGRPIVYTSADSVFQIAAHKEVIPLEELYEMCEKARDILQGEHGVARVIARPFVGEDGDYTRTAERKDLSIPPPHETLLDRLKNEGYDVIGLGKIDDIYTGQGLTEAVHTENNMDGVDKLLESINDKNKGLIMINLVDFDQRWGHRNNPEDYGKGLERFDERLPEILESIKESDVLVITADHGCDPTYEGTDHTREYVPLFVYGEELKKNIDLGTLETFADSGQTVADIFGLEPLPIGTSYWDSIRGATT
ncbi:MAG: phosphopentomutase [Candidatus Natronoplasma sp.]